MNNSNLSSISYLTYCITNNVIIRFGNTTCLDFSREVQILFPLGQFKKNYEKKLYEKKLFPVEILARF